jgi:hypothetical protein
VTPRKQARWEAGDWYIDQRGFWVFPIYQDGYRIVTVEGPSMGRSPEEPSPRSVWGRRVRAIMKAGNGLR